MARVLVCGAGVIGLATALLLAREGHLVTVVEADPQPPPTPDQAWQRWQRRGVPQFRQPHIQFPRFQHVLDQDLPDVGERLVHAGFVWSDPLATLPPTLPDHTARPGDERFRSLTGRRPVLEATFAAAAAEEPGVTVRRGVQLSGLLVEGDARPVRVYGVRTTDGDRLAADLVVDAMGRGSPVAGWLALLGAAPLVESQDRGFAYYTRYFRGDLPRTMAPPMSPLGSISLLTIPGDGDVWSVTVFATSRDRVVKQVRDPNRFDALLAACPLHAHWLDGEPLTDVLPMAGVLDRYRQFVVDEAPVAVGLLAVGDAWACTNPSGGRGLSLGLTHAQLLRDLLRTFHVTDPELPLAWDADTERSVTPFVRQQQRQDRLRIAEMEAERDGHPPPAPDALTVRLATAALRDADVFRATLELAMCLSLPEDVFARPGLVEAVERLGGDAPPELPGPSRRQLEELLSG